MNDLSKEGQGRPVVFGEVLYDCFPDGSEVLGGAPFNVAWHLQGMGHNPLFISRIGGDERGERILQTMGKWGMDTSGIQRDEERPTGKVNIRFEGDTHSFEIEHPSAYDFIDPTPVHEMLDHKAVSLLYHGSLALRSQSNQDLLDEMLWESPITVFLDINLREPWWDREQVMRSIRRARYVKLNEDELSILSDSTTATLGEVKALARQFLEEQAIDALLVTCGSEGAFWITADGLEAYGKHDLTSPIVDTVGAGDAFSGMVLDGILRRRNPEETLNRAVEFAAKVCCMSGATVIDHSLYKWKEGD